MKKGGVTIRRRFSKKSTGESRYLSEEAATIGRNRDASPYEEVLLLCLGLLYLCLSWLRAPLPLGDFLLKNLSECVLRVLFILLVFSGRFRLFALYRRKTYLVMGFFGIYLMKISFYLYSCFPVENWYIFALDMAEFAVLALFCGVIIEFTFAVLDQVLRTDKPFNCQLSLLSQRLLAREKVLSLMGRVMLYYTILIIIGLYFLNITYLFNWFFFSGSGAFLLLVAVTTTIALFEERLQRAGASQLSLIDQRLDKLLSGIEAGGSNQLGAEVGALIELRKQLIAAGRIPWGWRQVALVVGCVVSLLVQPYLYQAMSG